MAGRVMNTKEEAPKPLTWKGRPLEQVASEELEKAIAFYAAASTEFQFHAPAAVWVYIEDKLSELTVCQIQRMASAK